MLMTSIAPFLLKGGVALALTLNTAKIEANTLPTFDPPLIAGHVTVYCDDGVTATGTNTRKGICAGSELYLGKTIILYKRLPNGKVGDILGYYECEDTGGTPGIDDGIVIDVWRPVEEVQEFIDLTYEDECHGNVFIQVLE